MIITVICIKRLNVGSRESEITNYSEVYIKTIIYKESFNVYS